MKREKPISDAATEHCKKAFSQGSLSSACRLRPAVRFAAVTNEGIYGDDAGEGFLGETELAEPDKDPGKDSSAGIPNYARPAAAVPHLLPAASAVLKAQRLKKQENCGINSISPVPQNTS